MKGKKLVYLALALALLVGTVSAAEPLQIGVSGGMKTALEDGADLWLAQYCTQGRMLGLEQVEGTAGGVAFSAWLEGAASAKLFCTGSGFVPQTAEVLLRREDAPAQPNYEDSELARAVRLGIGSWRAAETPVTFAECMSMLDRVIALVDESALPQWRAQFRAAAASAQTMTRREGMVAVYFAAEALGPDYYGYNNEAEGGAIFDEIAAVDDWIFWDQMHGGDYSLFPSVDGETLNGEDSYVNAGYFYAMNRASVRTGRTIFDYDSQARSMHPDQPFTYTQALAAAVRLYDSGLVVAAARPDTEADRAILQAADARRERILNSGTAVAVTGTRYYVSTAGNDENDGLTEQTAWKTLKKVNEADLKPGDGVFLRRGDVWRGQSLIGQTGVTYSAYGEGEKPALYGSPENGAGAEKWTLVPGTDNIWKYHRAMPDCGDLVLDGSMDVAERTQVWWAGDRFVSYTPGEDMTGQPAFDPAEDLGDLEYFCDLDYGHLETAYPMYIYWEQEVRGNLYLRCDAGNPGVVYASIEFCCDLYKGCVVLLSDAEDCVVDNLAVLYGGHGIENCRGGLVQNCHVGYMGAMLHTFYSDCPIYSGDGIIHGDRMKVLNNYIHHTYNGGIAAGELSFAGDGEDANQPAVLGGNLVQGNLLEYTSGITLINWDESGDPARMFRDITIRDNHILFSESSGKVGDKSSDGVVGCLVFSGDDLPLPNPSENILVADNVFYCSKNALILSGMPESYYPTYSGNTYAQYPGGIVAWWLHRDGSFKSVSTWDPAEAERFVREELGDKTGLVLVGDGT